MTQQFELVFMRYAMVAIDGFVVKTVPGSQCCGNVRGARRLKCARHLDAEARRTDKFFDRLQLLIMSGEC